MSGTAVPPDGLILVMDTALARAVVALGRADGRLLDEEAWVAGHRHGEALLPRTEALLARAGVGLGDLAGLVVGTGPGAFTGLRVGIATAKALAHALALPLVGISTAAALLAGVDGNGEAGPDARSPALLLPAGPSDRVLAVDGAFQHLPAGVEPDAGLAAGLVAVDLPDRAPATALARGGVAADRLAWSLVRLGGARLMRGDTDDLAQLVPEYVTLPRGVVREQGEVAWSRGRR